MIVRRSPQAICDLDDIWLYIALDDPAAATRMVERIVRGVARLADFPRSGPARPEIGEDARSVTIGAYLILYRILPDAVEIVRIIHGARDVSEVMGEA